MDYVLHILVLAAVFSILAASLDLVVGQMGLLAVSHAAFFGVGAYTAAIAATRFECPFIAGLAAAATVAAVSSVCVSLPSLRLRGDYFVIATFGFQIVAFHVFNNWTAVTHGPLGITAIPRPSVFGFEFQSNMASTGLALSAAAVAWWVVWRISTSPLGRVLRAIRGSEAFAQSLGKDTLRCKITVFAVSAALAGVAGSFYAHYVSYIGPTSFTVNESILIVAMVIIGGADSVWGPVTGAVLLVFLPEALRFLGLPSTVAANLRQIIYGALLVALMLWRPQGLMGRYKFGSR